MIEIMPVAAFLVPFGIAFGVAASAKGIDAEVSLLMSMVVYAGAAQAEEEHIRICIYSG